MATAEGQLNGARDYRVRLDIWYSGVQDWNANTSRFDWNVWLIDAAGYGSWTNSTCSWSASIGGVGYGGNFTIPSNTAGQSRIVGSGSTWHGHDANGYRPGFPSSAFISVPHSNIGSGGSGDAWVDAPRIPVRPSAPGQPTFSELGPTSVRVSWPASADNGGQAINGYLLRRRSSAPADGPGYIDVSAEANTSRLVTGLTPGQIQFFTVYAYNGRGYSPKSLDSSITTLSGGRVGKDGAYPSAQLFVGKDGAYPTAESRVGKDGAFVNPV
ncbi:fibronectin type III domain-containing protein [Microbacterium sp. QXD-8]|uniref:Fibronectin type III domain-containing protein n=1 Tax=Microbacterium psychrotolerans TaxID=3068321 RepID=A0ABU0YYG9_9MICO|nr:fibronectin type III domain-containing protein [Microbacterium sp. QXD-8]MDQ7877378.1 fibronectin type III domain-containing protein [Microbacterium sp. QXD-8]